MFADTGVAIDKTKIYEGDLRTRGKESGIFCSYNQVLSFWDRLVSRWLDIYKLSAPNQKPVFGDAVATVGAAKGELTRFIEFRFVPLS